MSVRFNDALTQQHEGVMKIYHLSTDQKTCSSLSEKGTVVHCFDDNLLKRPRETVSKGTHKQTLGNSLEVSLKSLSWKSLPRHVKIEVPSKSGLILINLPRMLNFIQFTLSWIQWRWEEFPVIGMVQIRFFLPPLRSPGCAQCIWKKRKMP